VAGSTRTQRKSSLGGRFLLAFEIIAGLQALAALLGWLQLQDVASNQSKVINETIPAISDVRGFAEENSRVVAVAPELAAVTTEAARQERAACLLAQVNALRARMARYAVSGAESSGGLTDAVADVRASILGLDLLVRQRIVALQDQRTRLQAGLAATTELLEIADTLVANAQMGASAVISSLHGTDDLAAEARAETIDKLIEVDLFQMGLMFEFRAHTAEIGLLLNRVAAVGSQDDLARLRRDLVTRTGIVTRRILSIQDPIRAQRALVLLHAIGPAAAPPPDAADLFDVTHGILDINADIARAQKAVRVAATRLDAAAATLADQIEARAVQAGTDATAAIRVTQRLTAYPSCAVKTYPSPCDVVMIRDILGSSPNFARSRLISTSMVRILVLSCRCVTAMISRSRPMTTPGLVTKMRNSSYSARVSGMLAPSGPVTCRAAASKAMPPK